MFLNTCLTYVLSVSVLADVVSYSVLVSSEEVVSKDVVINSEKKTN